jgi:sec-independent protein translocase protein TatC
VGLFLAGAAFCYFVSPIFFAFLIAFNQSLGVIPEVALVPYLRFFLQLVLAVGLSFELPLVLMFLVYFGITSSRALTERWRGSVVIILVVVAIITPTTDPLSMTIVAVPLILLYFLSIWLAKLVEKRRANEEVSEPVVPTDDDPYGLGGPPGAGLAPSGVADGLPRQADGGFVNEKLLDDDVADDGEPPPGPGG